MSTIIILSGLVIFIYFIHRVFSKSRIEKKLQDVKTSIEVKKEIIKELDKLSKFPKFIPFYEWHGFRKGLHHENRLYFDTNGKKGVKPKKWKA
jgi:hypothetical protein